MDWTVFLQSALFSKQSGLLLTYALAAVFCIALILSFIYLLRRFGWLLSKREPFVFLELTFPKETVKSPYSTEQLFTLLHSLAKQHRLDKHILGHKKSYSLEITGTKKQGIRYVLVVSSSDAPTIKRSLLSYLPGLKIKEIEDYLPDDLDDKSENRKLGVSEFKLSNNFAFPLGRYKNLSEYDPISYLTGNMTKLKVNELMIFQAVVTPLNSSIHSKEYNHIAKLRKQIYLNQPLADELFQTPWRKTLSSSPLLLLRLILKTVEAVIKFVFSMIIAFWDTKGDRVPYLAKTQDKKRKENIKNPYEQELQAEMRNKIDQPLFETSLRLLIRSTDVVGFHQRTAGFLASFNSLGNSYQSLTLKGRGLLSFMRSPISTFAARRVSLAGNPILAVSELADIYHFPHTGSTKTEDLVKSHSQDLPAPLSLKNNNDLDVTFGVNNYGNTFSDIGLTDDDRSRHFYLIGQTGSGKSTIIHHMASDDIKKGRGLAVIDPHGDLAEGLLDMVPASRQSDVIYFNPFDIKHPIGINLLELSEGLEEDEMELEKELVCESVIAIFRRVFRKDENIDAHRIEYILRNAIYTAFTVPDRTIFTVYDLLTDPAFKKSVVKGLTDEKLVNFWKNEFGKAGDYQVVKMVSGVTAKIGRFLFSPIAKRIIEQPHSTIDFTDIVDNGKILICNLAEGKIGEDTAQLLGTTIIAKIHQAMTKRAQIESRKRKPFYLFVDEFQNFATGSFTKLLSGGRKYGLRITIAEQSTAQQDDRNIVNVILANVGTVVCFRTASPIDEDLMLAQFAPVVVRGDIANLPRHRFYMKMAATQPEDTFSGETIPILLTHDQRMRGRIIESSRKNYAIVYEKPIPKTRVAETKTKGKKDKKKDVPQEVDALS